MDRLNYLGAPEAYNLHLLAAVLNQALGEHNYLVGSSLIKRDFRDVDVRCNLPDVEFDRLFPDTGKLYSTNAFWCLICSSISEWLSSRADLKIDFQIQRQSDAYGPQQQLGLFPKET